MIVLVVTASWAVITVVIVLAPTLSGMGEEAVPEATPKPLTVIVAVASFEAGITC